jgi:hypothetical protein
MRTSVPCNAVMVRFTPWETGLTATTGALSVTQTSHLNDPETISIETIVK